MLMQALQLMAYGLSGVFIALAILYIIVKLIVKIFPGKAEDKS